MKEGNKKGIRLLGLPLRHFFYLKGGNLRKCIKVRFDGRLKVRSSRVLFMLSVTVAENLSQVPRLRKKLLVQYCMDRGLYDQQWGTVFIFIFVIY